MPILAWIFEALEEWGITRVFSWLSSFFKSTPQKDEDKAHAIENKVSGLSDDDAVKRVRDSLTN